MDGHTAEYWARQLRIGAGIAAVVTAIGGVRIALGWAPPDRWWLIPVVLVVLAQAAMIGLPWARLVRDRRTTRRLRAWWFGEVPVMLLFGWVDPDGWMLYVPAAVLLLITAAALWSPRFVIGLGVLSVGGYAVLLPVRAGTDLGTTFVLVAMMTCVVGLTAIHAQSRRWLDDRRQATEHRAETMLAASADAVIAIGPDTTIRYANASVSRLLGFRPGSLIGRRLNELLPDDRHILADTFLDDLVALPTGQSRRAESQLRNAAGEWVYLDVLATNWMDDQDIEAVVVSLRDIGARRALEDKLHRQAYTDSLTGMPNRALFRRRLEEAVSAGGAEPVTVLLLDLDDFKLVNDNLGHSAGDELLSTIAGRLRRHVRPSDVLARLGGDEFAILMHDLEPGDAAALAERLVRTIREPIRLASRDVTCSLSIGIATSAGHGEETVDADHLLGYADLAMYAAKRAGRNGYAVFDPTMTISVLEEAQLRSDLEQALEHDQFRVLYQPVVDMQTQCVTSVEALVRWQHPKDGLLGPYHFIAAAEANGLIVPLGRWVLREACAQLARWRAESPAAAGLKVNVNLSARQFQYAGLVSDVAEALADAGIDAASLTLEITESMLMEDIDTAKSTLHALRALGVRLAIDDFGTGYSSLSYLKQLPVDVIKIDKTFVDDVHIDADDVALVDAVAGLGQALKMQTVAEGIETDEQWTTLRTIGIDHGQGYLFGRPAAPDEINELLTRVSAISA
ncbi:putative bifunctional diguanylate cyclase/phosphodiesterase [Paractinoplanes brasiliensis]|uniref:PAS domain S-box-containing protein/diguanylate cyclase (GGDEF)-like protein n=1 Tax=Paractinoplanes brasiliensis TaxID=52695 RepID=A0A4R6JZC2_9ACTN|nr:GGDEF and EAL domain-containing protein [Actinoplanes brasiliensis]TDO41111.1 PAS domain S-box-containing protein/diguanylate cyclase (GGDEF)-like protein [Actinoplanes brasiliensis]GID26181.1 two-component system response regulator [Actinoplanes brasiliensis]